MIFFAYAFVFVIAAMTLRETADSHRRKRSRHIRGRVAQREVLLAAPARPAATKQAAQQAKDQTHKDCVSSFVNFGFGRKQADAAAMRTAGTFEERLRGSLAILKNGEMNGHPVAQFDSAQSL